MLRSMFSAISGLRGHQIMMDVIGNNIANVNTVGFKAGRVNFQDILSQTLHGATAPSGGLGSIDPAQIGLGMTVAGIDVLQTQGNLQSTGKTTDMAIQGDGFFVESDGSATYYTRDGAFDIGLDGSLSNPASGMKVQGWQADANGNIDITQPITNLVIPIGQRTTALATSHITLGGNLDAGAATGTAVPTTMTVFDDGCERLELARIRGPERHRHHRQPAGLLGRTSRRSGDRQRHDRLHQRRCLLGSDRHPQFHLPRWRHGDHSGHRSVRHDPVQRHQPAGRPDRRLQLGHAGHLRRRQRR
jgi:hypothetical protein